jgi:hypothetical protein
MGIVHGSGNLLWLVLRWVLGLIALLGTGLAALMIVPIIVAPLFEPRPPKGNAPVNPYADPLKNEVGD